MVIPLRHIMHIIKNVDFSVLCTGIYHSTGMAGTDSDNISHNKIIFQDCINGERSKNDTTDAATSPHSSQTISQLTQVSQLIFICFCFYNRH